MGNEQLVYLSLAGQTVIVRRAPPAIADIGMKHGIQFLADKIIFFDEGTGELMKRKD